MAMSLDEAIKVLEVYFDHRTGNVCEAMRVLDDFAGRGAARVVKLETALTHIANGDFDSFAGDPGKWPTTIAALALGWVSDEPGGKLHPPVSSSGEDSRTK